MLEAGGQGSGLAVGWTPSVGSTVGADGESGFTGALELEDPGPWQACCGLGGAPSLAAPACSAVTVAGKVGGMEGCAASSQHTGICFSFFRGAHGH